MRFWYSVGLTILYIYAGAGFLYLILKGYYKNRRRKQG